MEQLTTEQRELDTAWLAFEYWTGSSDSERFQRAYLGHYADRDSFGHELMRGFGADARLQRLPDWLRAYIRFDGEAVAADFERAGHFYIYDAPNNEVFSPAASLH